MRVPNHWWIALCSSGGRGSRRRRQMSDGINKQIGCIKTFVLAKCKWIGRWWAMTRQKRDLQRHQSIPPNPATIVPHFARNVSWANSIWLFAPIPSTRRPCTLHTCQNAFSQSENICYCETYPLAFTSISVHECRQGDAYCIFFTCDDIFAAKFSGNEYWTCDSEAICLPFRIQSRPW